MAKRKVRSPQTKYASFLVGKRPRVEPHGPTCAPADVHSKLFPFQRDLVRWAVRKGRCALFADTGLGKTFMQLEWARLIGEKTLFLAPLSVARQTVDEAKKIGIDVAYSRDGQVGGQFTITNYELVDRFVVEEFGAVVLDESSILKSLNGKTRAKLIELFAETPYRLCCTATPAPNDIAEIANHAEFLGIMSRADMLATFFVHDSGSGGRVAGWRLKGHAEEAFYRWLASWGMSVRKPSDLGYDDDGFILPKLTVRTAFVTSNYAAEGRLFPAKLKGIQDRSRVRKQTLTNRVAKSAELANASDEQWIVWCGLNAEGKLLEAAIPGSVNVEGSDSLDKKIAALELFQSGATRVLITKPRIAGFGMNFQNCHNMAFVGLSDSWESYYQCIRRCYRFGQESPVDVHVVLSDAEEAIYTNVSRKQEEADKMAKQLIKHVAQFEAEELAGNTGEDWQYEKAQVRRENYTLMLGDSAERMKSLRVGSADLSVFSPPFLSLYTYSPTERDLGNSADAQTFFAHFNYIIDELLRVTKPGRNCCVHVSQVPATMVYDGFMGVKDFRGQVIQSFEGRGWVYHGEVCIDKDPQAQAIRTKSKALLFVQLRRDAAWLRPALADYILVFRKPGENAVPIRPDITNEQWIEWARPIWYGIRESETLNAAEGRGMKDERHIAPLQLGTIERCIRLWSNEGETVLSPFAGIGSEGYVALKHNRKFIGIELKRSYYEAAKKNLRRASRKQATLFSSNSHAP